MLTGAPQKSQKNFWGPPIITKAPQIQFFSDVVRLINCYIIIIIKASFYQYLKHVHK